MDFGFAPPNDDFAKAALQMLQRRPNTQVIDNRNLSSIQQFIQTVGASKVRPVQDLLLETHGGFFGSYVRPLVVGQHGDTTYERLDEAVANKAIEIPDAFIGYNAGDPLRHSVHFLACNIGKFVPLLERTKEAFGNHVHVTAPKFVQVFDSKANIGVIEYMKYEFIVSRPTPFTKPAERKQLIDLFAAGDVDGVFRGVNGMPVRRTTWDALIQNLHRHKPPVTYKLPQVFGSLGSLQAYCEFAGHSVPHPLQVPYAVGAPVPTNDALLREQLETSLRATPQYDDNHKLPMWRRLGFASFDAFFAGHDWNPGAPIARSDGSNLVPWVGGRHVYVIKLPITVATLLAANNGGAPPSIRPGTLQCNLYPDAGSGFVRRDVDFRPTDGRFFGRTP